MYPREARTALGAAFIRAAHTHFGHRPLVFEDRLADLLLEAEEKIEFREYFSHQFNSWRQQDWFQSRSGVFAGDAFIGYMRTSPLVPEVLARQAFAERILLGSSTNYAQYVILGAGFDSFSFRNPDPNLVVYEVDRNEVSRFKRSRTALLENVVGRDPIYVATTLGSTDLGVRLLRAGLRTDLPTLVSCLGLTPYLSLSELTEMFASVRRVLCRQSTIAYDYTMPEALSPAGGCPFTIELASRLDKLGDPLCLELSDDGHRRLLENSGFRLIEQLVPREIQERYFMGRRDGLSAASHVVLASAIAI
jgi:methyltransferase (TIGR00027 family)